jgi:hypothetical protein
MSINLSRYNKEVEEKIYVCYNIVWHYRNSTVFIIITAHCIKKHYKGGPRYSRTFYLQIRLFISTKRVQNNNFPVKNGLFICEFEISGPKWRSLSTANNEGNLYYSRLRTTAIHKCKKMEDMSEYHHKDCYITDMYSEFQGFRS